jgi:DNA polymerase (family 10)
MEITNKKTIIIEVLERLALLGLLKGDNHFKIEAFKKAAHNLSSIENFDDLYKEGRLREIPGIGKGITQIIDQVMHDEPILELLKPENIMPSSLFEVCNIKHVGPKKALILYKELGIKSIGELEYACLENRLLNLKGFGPKTQNNIIASIQEHRKNQGLFRIDQVYNAFLKLKEENKNIALVGDAKRGEITAPYLEVLVLNDIKKHQTNIPVKIHVCPSKELFGIYELFLTGDSNFLDKITDFALNKGFTLSLKGLFKKDQFLACPREEDIFSHLGLFFIDPIIRDQRSKLVSKTKLTPRLIELKDLRGAFHNHTVASDGKNTLEEMAHEASRCGLQYLSINDHSKSAFYAHGLKPDDILRQIESINLFNKNNKDFYVFSGTESDILQNGDLDFDDSILEKLDIVVASIHSRLKQDEDEMTKRLIKAIENPYTTILGHPTGRLILDREPSKFSMEKILSKAHEHGVVMELNANPHRLDLSIEHLILAKEAKVMIAINPDAHSTKGLSDLYFGAMMAKKAHLTPDDVLNTLALDDIKKWIYKTKEKRLSYAKKSSY